MLYTFNRTRKMYNNYFEIVMFRFTQGFNKIYTQFLLAVQLVYSVENYTSEWKQAQHNLYH